MGAQRESIEDPELTDDGKRPAIRWVRTVQRVCIVVALVLSLVQQVLLASYRVAGSSMTPAFLDGDRVLVSRTPGFFGEPRRGETVIASVNGEVVIKRVAGVPGDVVSLGNGVLHVDGHVADDAVPACYQDGCSYAPLKLERGMYFLLGDHRRVSIDSREFGPIARDAIVGRVILRVPQSGAGSLAGALARH